MLVTAFNLDYCVQSKTIHRFFLSSLIIAAAQLSVLVPVVSVRRRPSQNEAGVSEVSLCDGPLPRPASRRLQGQNSHRAGCEKKGERGESGE